MNIAFFCMGHGTLVADLDTREHGDMKYIAYIRPSGKICYRVAKSKVPMNVQKQIIEQAELEEEKFLSWFNSLPLMSQFREVLNVLTTDELLKRGQMEARETVDKYFPLYKERC